MKKILLSILLCISLILSTTPMAYAADKIVEVPTAKIIMEGKVCTFKDVTITVNGNAYISLIPFLTNIGVKNDKTNIIPNDKDKSVTFLKDKVKYYVKVGSKSVTVNGKAVSLDQAPVLYKTKIYIPATLASKCFTKKVIWQSTSNTLFIRDEKEFNKVKDILTKSNAAMKKVERLKSNMDVAAKTAFSGISMNITITSKYNLDIKNKRMYMNMKMGMGFMDIDTEMYYADNKQYLSDPSTGTWIMKTLSDEEFKNMFQNTQTTVNLEVNDATCAGLLMTNGTKADEVVLKGDIYIKELVEKALQNTETADSNYTVDTMNIAVTINKNTYYTTKTILDIKGNILNEGEKQKLDMLMTITLSDFNSNFKVEVPAEVLENAVEEESIDMDEESMDVELPNGPF